MKERILVVEDDARITDSIRDYLEGYGYITQGVTDWGRVEAQWRQFDPHLVILDVNLPGKDGFHLCQEMRRYSPVPILFLSARSGEMEQIYGMESGGDDYMTKPFRLDVLLAKIKALLRRAYGSLSAAENRPMMVQVGSFTFWPDKGEMEFKGERQSLSKNEWKLLALLLERQGQVVTRDDCLEALWDDQRFVDDNTLTVNVTRLRKKLARWGLDGAVQTHRGVGYRLDSSILEGGG
ncbi:response regulator transcription factor [Desmospora profundinema]|uniref:DNA-binding response OmpR family regulator n=1 Tax=Desmospora profundinema TaxID=1571184 RepID=A0ABU1ISZ8_9BACL|nr:response regulator transcription factor [Desmospora profundinema]MDR6226900.1 DNA-binding response OmpR family regulator [Desmospora profundinema]